MEQNGRKNPRRNRVPPARFQPPLLQRVSQQIVELSESENNVGRPTETTVERTVEVSRAGDGARGSISPGNDSFDSDIASASVSLAPPVSITEAEDEDDDDIDLFDTRMTSRSGGRGISRGAGGSVTAPDNRRKRGRGRARGGKSKRRGFKEMDEIGKLLLPSSLFILMS